MDSDDLFDFPVGMPLAARMRPLSPGEVRGHETLFKEGGPLGGLLDSGNSKSIQSIILYGPPGTGKTTIARIIARQSQRRFIEISAVNSSISDLRAAMQSSAEDIQVGRSASIVFIDEIHRFSKVQLESLLKAIEDGQIVLVGATTENPGVSLTPAILSRATVLELHALNSENLVEILQNACLDERGLANQFKVGDGVLEKIASFSGGDARKALTILETVSVNAGQRKDGMLMISDVEKSMPKALNRYDATGDQHYDIISAFIKSVRGSDPDAALHWLARMLEGGEDPRFIARRLIILASEDIGLADPQALVIANAALQAINHIGMPEGRIPLASTTIYLALAPKSNSAYLAINKALSDVQSGITPEVPSHLRSAAIGKDPSYEYPHDLPLGVSEQEYLPRSAQRRYYHPKSIGFEANLVERLKRIFAIFGRNL